MAWKGGQKIRGFQGIAAAIKAFIVANAKQALT